MNATRIRGLSVRDIRFPTSLDHEGSDALHTDPDHSCAYVIIYTDADVRGHGLTFTIGRGTELAVSAIKSLSRLVVGKSLKEIFTNFSSTWRMLSSDSQLRWVGPEKGVVHLATSAIVNALFDLWARINRKPLWKFLVDMEPEELVSIIDFRYINDVLSPEEAIEMLYSMQEGKESREKEMIQVGYPAYTTAPGWMGYSEEKIQQRAKEYLIRGWRHFKIKVGDNLQDDKRRCTLIRKAIGEDSTLMLDAKQMWSVDEAIERMKELKQFNPIWIEEPTSPDDILGHATIKKALNEMGIGVVTGDTCQNRVMFKQFFQLGAVNCCTIDPTRVGGVPEALSIYLMAKKFNIPICPGGAGMGLSLMAQHLQIWDYVSVSCSKESRFIEYVSHLQEHFKFTANFNRNCILAPKIPGYSTEMWFKSLAAFEYPDGPAWQMLFKKGLYDDPSKRHPPYIESVQ